ncbi:7 transmembrane receptor (rhodopsin), partial [Sarracenia purpurea var. burkii]
VWLFGDYLCSVWLALDVWMCTASILNLCAISLVLYIAITRPVAYPNTMTMKRAKFLVGLVWIISFLICFPPLIGWRNKVVQPTSTLVLARNIHYLNSTMRFSDPMSENKYSVNPQKVASCPWVCELTNDTGYVVYSAFGSFYIPMFVMMFFYWRIYVAAIITTKAINEGCLTVRTLNNETDESYMTLRIHRGRGSSVRNPPSSNSVSSLQTSTFNSLENTPRMRSPDTKLKRSSTRRFERAHDKLFDTSPAKTPEKGYDKVKISVSYPSTDCLNTMMSSGGGETGTNPPAVTEPTSNNATSSIASSSRSNSGNLYVHYSSLDNNVRTVFHKEPGSHLRVGGGRLSDTPQRRSSVGDTFIKTRHLSEQLSSPIQKDLSPSPSCEDTANQKVKLFGIVGRRNLKTHIKRFRMETKAAKKLGVIVGGFILCWLPFFTMYLIRAFCDSCIHPVIFSIMFWLGYCNSAIDPMLYALFSKDFRRAFQRIIYSCFSRKFRLRDSRNARKNSGGSQSGASKRADRSPSYNDFPLNSVVIGSQHSDSEPTSTEIK